MSEYNLFNYLGDLLYNLLYWFFQPIFDILNSIYTGITNLINEIIGFFADIFGLFSTVLNFFNLTLGALLDNAWSTVMITGFTIVIGLRIYSFIKNHKIAGSG